jgi:aminopeptidase N
VLSINRGFSAPVAIDADTQRRRIWCSSPRSDDDPFARYEAMQSLVVRYSSGDQHRPLEERDPT